MRTAVFLIAWAVWTLLGSWVVYKRRPDVGSLIGCLSAIILWPFVLLFDFLVWWSESMDRYWADIEDSEDTRNA